MNLVCQILCIFICPISVLPTAVLLHWVCLLIALSCCILSCWAVPGLSSWSHLAEMERSERLYLCIIFFFFILLILEHLQMSFCVLNFSSFKGRKSRIGIFGWVAFFFFFWCYLATVCLASAGKQPICIAVSLVLISDHLLSGSCANMCFSASWAASKDVHAKAILKVFSWRLPELLWNL